MIVVRIVDNSRACQVFFYLYDLPGMAEAPSNLGNMITAVYHVCHSHKMVEGASLEHASNSKRYIDKEAFVLNVFVGEASDGEKIQPMKVRPFPADNADGPDKGEEVEVVMFDENVIRWRNSSFT